MTKLTSDILNKIDELLKDYNKCLDCTEKVYNIIKSSNIDNENIFYFEFSNRVSPIVNSYDEISYVYNSFNQQILQAINEYIKSVYNIAVNLYETGFDFCKERKTREELINFFEENLKTDDLIEESKNEIKKYLKRCAIYFGHSRCRIKNTTLIIESCSHEYIDNLDKLLSIYNTDEIKPMYNLSNMVDLSYSNYIRLINKELNGGLCSHIKTHKNHSVHLKFRTKEDLENVFDYLKIGTM